MIKVNLIGAGNVGFHLHAVLQNAADVQLLQWYNRTKDSMAKHASNTNITDNITDLQEADIYLICVSDDQIEKLGANLGKRKGIVAHTAGSVPLEALKAHENHGVFYPLQTFSKQKEVDFHTIPLCLEANNLYSLKLLQQLAAHIGGPIHTIDSVQRKALHIAAVFVNNFSNHLYAIGEALCQEHHVPFSILQPLIAETADKIKNLSPLEAQTGPALRKDNITIENHLLLLTQEAHKKIYSLLTASIQQQQHE